MHKAMNKPVAADVVQDTMSIEAIKLHLFEQYHLPMEQIDTLLPSFITTLGTHMSNLEKALSEKNTAQLGKLGHTIKGAFLNLGLQDCAQIALTIEEKGRQGGMPADFGALVEELRLLIKPILEQDFTFKKPRE